MMIAAAVIAVVGMCIAGYAWFIEKKMENDRNYKPMCDISDRISCSRAFQSPSSKLWGIANSLIGVYFYGAIALLALLHAKSLVMIGATGGLVMTCYFAYLLYVRVQSFCLVCTSTYVVNILLFIAALQG